MLYVLTGKDEYSKREFISELSKREGLRLEKVSDPLLLSQYIPESLFDVKCLVVCQLTGKEENLDIDGMISSSNYFCLSISSPLKLKLPKENILDFPVPKYSELNEWMKRHLNVQGFAIDREASELIVKKLFGRPVGFIEVKVDVDLLISELEKLILFCQDKKKITREDVEMLTSDVAENSIFELIDLIAAKDISGVNLFCKKFFDVPKNQIQSKLIPLIALISESLRNWILVKQLSEQEITSITGYKPGRIYILKKQSAKFNLEQLKTAHDKLLLIDQMIKTGEGGTISAFVLTVKNLLS